MSSPCFLCGELCNKGDRNCIFDISQSRWDKFRTKAEEWKDLDRFTNVFESVDWDSGPQGKAHHEKCRITLNSSRALYQAKNRKEKPKNVDHLEEIQEETEQDPEPEVQPRATRSSTGLIHEKNKCVWCLGEDNTKNGQPLMLLSYDHGFDSFKSHTIIISDDQTRARVNTLLEWIDEDYTAIEIRYHPKCWTNNVRKWQNMNRNKKRQMVREKTVSLREVQALFMDHVREVIFQEHEMRSLQTLLNDYKDMRYTSGHIYGTEGLKSAYVKELLLKEFGDKIGCHQRPRLSFSEIVYDTSGGGPYIESAITSFGISDQQLSDNFSKRLVASIESTGNVPWPPSVDELEEPEDLSKLALNFVASLRRKKGKIDINSPKVISLTSLLSQFTLDKPTKTAINSSVTKHGISRSKELVDADYNLGTGTFIK